MLELNDARHEKICDRKSSLQKYNFMWMAEVMLIIITQHQCGLDGTPSKVHKTRPLKKYGTSHKSTSLQHQHQYWQRQ